MTTRKQASKREQERIRNNLPFTDEEWAVIKAAQADFWTFLNTAYAASFEGEEFLYADGTFGPFKLSTVHEMWAVKVAGRQPAKAPYNRWRIMAPRMHLKSTVLGRGYIFWRFFSEGQDVDAFYFDYKKPLAEEHVTELKRAIEKNPYARFWTDNNPTATSIIDFTVAFRESTKEEDEEEGSKGKNITWRAECEAEGILAATRGRHPKIVICFAPGTKVRTGHHSYQAIEDLREGDQVIGHSGKYRRVTQTYRHQYDGDLVVLTLADGDVIKVTPNHPLLTTRGKRAAGELVVGDVLEHAVVKEKRPHTCEYCGQEYVPAANQSHSNKRRFCGKSCATAARNKITGHWRQGSKNGRWKGGPAVIQCVGCAVSFTDFRNGAAAYRRYCSRTCKAERQMETLKGSGNPNWRGGHGPVGRGAGPEFTEELREQIRDLYNRRCADCSVAEAGLAKRLHVHHIDRDRWNNAIENLIALCSPCHMRTNINTRHDERLRGLVALRNGTKIVAIGRMVYEGPVYNLEVEEDHTYCVGISKSIAFNCDDILSDFANPAEAAEITRINDIFDRTISSLPPPDGTLGVVGTPQSPHDILHKLQENDLYYCGVFPAVKDYATEDVLWPEMFDFRRLMAIKRPNASAFEVEYQLHPRESVDQFLDTAAIEAAIDNNLQRFVPREEEKWDNPDNLNVYGGMDVGKEVHPSHIVFMVELPPEPEEDMGWLLQIYEAWLDGMKYNEQVVLLNDLIRYFNPTRFYFDNTRSELEDRGLTARATGLRFSRPVKGSMSTLLEKRLNNSWYHSQGGGEDAAAGPGLIIYGPEDGRQTRSLKQVKKDLSASENEDGHGDAFWSNALAVYALESGPRITNLGSAQDLFGGHRRTTMHSLDCDPDFQEYTVPDPLGLKPPTRFRKCENCGFKQDL